VLLDFLCINNSQDLPQKPFAEELFYSRERATYFERKTSPQIPQSTWK